MLDIIIRNGFIIDGTGSPQLQADIGIKSSKIEKIGVLKNESAKKEIDAEGLFVAPGFIDINTDSDHQLTIFTNPYQKNFVMQGVTTIIGGNCGSSLAPLLKGSLVSIRKWTDPNQININWKTVKEFLEIMEKRKLGVNFGTLIGHSTLRRDIIGEKIRELKEEELKTMRFLIEEGLKEGAFGLSFGLAYSHSRITPYSELQELTALVKHYNALCSLHLRSEAENFLESVEEIYNLARYSRANIQINHFKAHIPYEKRFGNGLQTISQKNSDVPINFDIYPYDTGAFHLYTLLPSWAASSGFEKMVETLKNPEFEKKIIKELKNKKFDFENIRIAESAGQTFLAGKTIKKIAENRGIAAEEALCQILKESLGRTTVFIKNNTLENIKTAIKNPLSYIASNGTGYDKEPKGIFIHPRSMGTFPRFLSLVRRENIMTWEQAIIKITSGPAAKLGLKDRGAIRGGSYADITIFDPNTIDDLASYEKPFVYPVGIKYVLINGNVAVENGDYKEGLYGAILKKI